jgi:transglutaminase-like putative cysteine protease
MLYAISLRITYAYETPAATGQHALRLLPANIPGVQKLIAGHVHVTPRPSSRVEREDFFGVNVVDIAFREPHASTEFFMQARVEKLPQAEMEAPSTALADLPAELHACRALTPDSPLHFLSPSPRVAFNKEFSAYARNAMTGARTVEDAVHAIGFALHRDMTFDPQATTVETPAAEAFASRRGVCQDFSHIMIACLRGIGIPAAYVSGFLRTIPPPGQARLEGADAMHAWVRAWCGAERGWIEFDPTNAKPAGEDHIVIGYAQDYSGIAPVKGISRMTGKQTSTQAVDVVPM